MKGYRSQSVKLSQKKRKYLGKRQEEEHKGKKHEKDFFAEKNTIHEIKSACLVLN